MKVSYNWLKEYVDINVTPEKLAEFLTMRSFEVENIAYQGEGLDGVVVGEILNIKKHPNADKLNISEVDVGEKKPRQIVFGQMAKIEIGLKVPVALASTVLPGNKKIEKSKLRGELSEGMLCLDQELGLLEEGISITFFDKSVKNGTPIKKALGLDDVIFDLDILPNRAHDCLSHIGVARECAAIISSKFKVQGSRLEEERKRKIEDFAKVEIKDKKLCPRYTARVITNIQVKDSPQRMKNRLKPLGVRPINNIVDITNYVMLEYGQPLHTFDADSLTSYKSVANIIVRKAKKNETIITLDGKRRKLDQDMLIIADRKRPIAIAGIMGGKNTEVNKKTKTIILESANFEPINIRKTSRKLGLKSGASDRFEKGLDPNLASLALDRAAYLIQKLAGGEIVQGTVDIYPKKVRSKIINLSLEKTAHLLGVKIGKDKIIRILKSLEFEVKQKGDRLQVKVPAFRLDVNIPEDLIEEIARLYQYDNIPAMIPKAELSPPTTDKVLYWGNIARDILTNNSFTEVYNYSFVGDKELTDLKMTTTDHLEIINPSSKDQKYLRISLVPNLLKNIKNNLRNFDEFRIFEIGHTYRNVKCQMSNVKCLEEKKMLAGAIVGEKNREQLFYEIKGVVESLMERLGINQQLTINNRAVAKAAMARRRQQSIINPIWHPGRLAIIKARGKILGIIGEIHPQILSRVGVKTRVAMFDLDLETLASLATKEKKYQPIIKFPQIILDLAIVVDAKTLVQDIQNAIYKTDVNLIKKVELFDIYQNKKLGKNKKNLAFHIIYQSNTHTLTQDEAEIVHSRIVKRLEKKFKAEIRKGPASAKATAGKE